MRGLPLKDGRERGRELLENHGLGYAAERQIRQLSKGMAQTVQLLGTLVHKPQLVVLDEPFSGLDALNQGKLERMIRDLAAQGTTVIFSTHVIAHAERLCEGRSRSSPAAKCPSAGRSTPRATASRPQVRLETNAKDGRRWRDRGLLAERAGDRPTARVRGSFRCPARAGSSHCCAR